MKRSERHHLKENELALSVAHVGDWFEANRTRIVGVGLAVVLVAAAIGGYFWWRNRAESSSRSMLAEAMAIQDAQVVPPAAPAAGETPAAASTPPPPGSYPSEEAKLKAAYPKFMAAADAYPSRSAGIAARYHAASALVALGRPKEAIDRYREVIDRAGNGLYADMARLGLAEAQVAAGQYDAAIKEYRELATRQEIPTDAVLMQLGRAYALAGKKAEAKQTFERILNEFPQSLYAEGAKKEAGQL